MGVWHISLNSWIDYYLFYAFIFYTMLVLLPASNCDGLLLTIEVSYSGTRMSGGGLIYEIYWGNTSKGSKVDEASKILKAAVQVCEKSGKNMEDWEGRTSGFRGVLRMFHPAQREDPAQMLPINSSLLRSCRTFCQCQESMWSQLKTHGR